MCVRLIIRLRLGFNCNEQGFLIIFIIVNKVPDCKREEYTDCGVWYDVWGYKLLAKTDILCLL